MRGERATYCKVIDYIGENDRFKRYDEMTSEMSSGDAANTSKQVERFFKMAGLALMPSGWFDQNKLFLARGEQAWITDIVMPEAHLVSPQKFRAADKAFSDMVKRPARPWNFMAKEFLPALGAAGQRAAHEQISVDLARTAIVLEHYRLAHGEYPESLDALAPQVHFRSPA